jgi:hypothetical protein
MQLRGVVLVEGTSDRRAVETLARRRGRDLQAEAVAIVPMGGYARSLRNPQQYWPETDGRDLCVLGQWRRRPAARDGGCLRADVVSSIASDDFIRAPDGSFVGE